MAPAIPVIGQVEAAQLRGKAKWAELSGPGAVHFAAPHIFC
jgi:hypothetical protein